MSDSLSEPSESVTRAEEHESHAPTENIAPRHGMRSVRKACALFFHQLCCLLEGRRENRIHSLVSKPKPVYKNKKKDTCMMTTDDDEDVVALFERDDRTIFFDP